MKKEWETFLSIRKTYKNSNVRSSKGRREREARKEQMNRRTEGKRSEAGNVKAICGNLRKSSIV